MRFSSATAHLAAVIAFCALISIARPAVAQDATNPGQVAWTASFEPAEAAAGGHVLLVVSGEVPDGWHTYPVAGADADFRTSIEVDLAGAPLTPAADWVTADAKKDEAGIAYVDGMVRFSRSYKVSGGATPGKHGVSVAMEYMLCDENQCLPPEKTTLKAGFAVGTGETVSGDDDLKSMIKKLQEQLAEALARIEKLEAAQSQTTPMELPEGMDANGFEQAIEGAIQRIEKKRERAGREAALERQLESIPQRTPRLVEFMAQRLMLTEEQSTAVSDALVEFQTKAAKNNFEAWDKDWTEDKQLAETAKLSEQLRSDLKAADMDDESIDQIMSLAQRMGGQRGGRGGFGGQGGGRGGFGGQGGGRGGFGGQGGGQGGGFGGRGGQGGGRQGGGRGGEDF